MIHVCYSNDPLAQDQGGGAEHFRGLYRALAASDMPFRLLAARLQDETRDRRIVYLSRGSGFPRFFAGLCLWFWRNRHQIAESDVFHFHRNYAAWPKYLLCPRRGRVVITYHNVTGRVLDGKLGRLAAPLRALMLRFERRAVARADALICVSRRDREELGLIVAQASFSAAEIVPAGFDAGLFAAATSVLPPRPECAGRLLYLGRLSHQKNLALAIATLERLVAGGADATLTIAGDGEDAAAIDVLVASSPVRDRICRVGLVPHDEVPALLAAHGIVLVTSRYEASPTVVKEALAACRPVVTTDVGDVREWLEEGRTGFIRPAGPDELAEGVCAAMRLLRNGRYRAGSAAALAGTASLDGVLSVYRRLAAA